MVYGPEIIGSFGLEEKSQKPKAVCGLGRTNYGGLGNVRPTIIDHLNKITKPTPKLGSKDHLVKLLMERVIS